MVGRHFQNQTSHWAGTMRKTLLLALSMAVFSAPVHAGTDGTSYYKPGRWLEVLVDSPGRITAPGTTTVVEKQSAEAQYVLPMSAPWSAAFNGVRLDVAGIAEGGWVAAELAGAAGNRTAERDGILEALPPGSVVAPLGDIRRGVPSSFDLVICYDFSEGNLQPQERIALEQFVRRGGAVFLIFASRAIPAGSVGLWRTLFGATGTPQKQAPGLPRGLRVPGDFELRFDAAMPRLVWQRCGRGVVIAYGLAPNEKVLEQPEGTTELFNRVVFHIREARRPLTLGPVEPDVFGLFEETGWSASSRWRFALLACGYAGAAAGLILSFGSFVSRRRWMWLAGMLCIAAGGAAVILGATADRSGLALDTVAMVIQEPQTDPVDVVLGRISRLGPEDALQLRSATPIPPRLVLHSRFSASRKNWVNYRFFSHRSTVEPMLDTGQRLCLASVRAAAETTPGEQVQPPPNADKLIGFFRKHWAEGETTYTFRWARSAVPRRLFESSAGGTFSQISRATVLFVSGAKKSPAVPR